MTYAIKNDRGQYLQIGPGKFGNLHPTRTFLYTNKRDAFALAEFYGYTVVEVMLAEVRIVSQ